MKRLRCHNALAAAIIILVLLGMTGCARWYRLFPSASKEPLQRVSRFSYPDFWDDMAFDGLEHAIAKSLDYYHRVPSTRKFRFATDTFDTGHMIESLERFRAFILTRPAAGQVKTFIEDNYWIYRSKGGKQTGRVLFTGYFEPILTGQTDQTQKYRYPLYARPADIVSVNLSRFSKSNKGKTIVGRVTDHTVVPYYDRKDIDSQGALEGKAPVLAWVDNPVDPFFLHIQGSGKVYLETGNVLNVHYHLSNGHPYRSIGKLLIDRGKISRADMSMQAIRSYLHAHPKEMEEIFNYNPSYVFFKTETDAPIGYLGVKLTPGRSIALDRRIFPNGALGFVRTKQPLIDAAKTISRWSDASRFILNQDTGGAIRGPGRADLFWGNGPYAEIAAGHLRHPGDLYFLVLKPDNR